MMQTLRIDPHRVRDHNRISTRITHAIPPLVLIPSPGDWVRVVDDEGNVLCALVDDVDATRVYLKIDWASLIPASGWKPDPYGFAFGAGAPLVESKSPTGDDAFVGSDN